MPLAFTGVGGETVNLDILDGSADEWRISINTTSQITGNKTLAFVGTPFDSCVIRIFNEGGFNTTGASKLIINGDTIPDIYAASPCEIIYRYNGSVWFQSILLTSGGISGGDIEDDSIPADKLQNDIAGSGMTRDGNGGVVPNLEASQPSMQVVADELGVKLDPSRGVTKNSNGVGVNLEASNPSLQISANELGVKIASDGGLEKTSDGMEVKLDPNGGLAKTSNGVSLAGCVCFKAFDFLLPSSQVLTLNSIPFIAVANTVEQVDRELICAYIEVGNGTTPYATNTLLTLRCGSTHYLELDLAGLNTGRYEFNRVVTATTPNISESNNNRIQLEVDAGNPTAGDYDIAIHFVFREIDRLINA